MNDRNRGILVVAVRAGEGRFTEPTAGARAGPRELVFLPPRPTPMITLTNDEVGWRRDTPDPLGF